MTKERLDSRMARETGLSRARAAAAILAGEVKVGGKPARKPGQALAGEIEYTPRSTAVSRAAGKLAPVLATWNVSVEDKVVLDVGASTGGFTQTVLEAGARNVIAVDVGHGQLAWSLRNDPRVINLEKTDIRKFQTKQKIDIVLIDVSFISLRLILPNIEKLIPKQTQIIAMVKPQFEAGASRLNKGVIKNDSQRRKILLDFEIWAKQNWLVLDKADSQVAGAKGNVERFYLLKKQK